jgi:hypothetical protein
MTGGDETLSMKAIELCRDLQRRAAIECERHGVSLEDAAVASIYASHDIAQRFNGGDPFAAIEWLRTGLDLMERQLMEGAKG